ncbi:hypothetical protein KKC45_03800 [Patescibacteria group bacterium]|nr:hypothetical protein [Patescibacteria group bacterium]
MITKNIKISILIAVVMIVSAFVYSNKNDQEIQKTGNIYFGLEENEEIDNSVAGDYYTRFFSPEGKDQLFKLGLSPMRPKTIQGGARASLKISYEDGSDVWKLGGWDFGEDDQIIVTLSGSSKGEFVEPEVFEFVYKDDSLIATKYNKDIYNIESLVFSKNSNDINISELKDIIEISPCGRSVRADNIVFGGFSFTKAFERVSQENVKTSFCGNEKYMNPDFYSDILGIGIKEWRWAETGKAISDKEGPVNSYIIALYSKENNQRKNNPFDSGLIYKFDFSENKIYRQTAFDGSFYEIGTIKESDFDNEEKSFSSIGSLFLYFKDIDKDYDVKKEPQNIIWNDGDGYNILIPAKESFVIAKTGLSPVEFSLVADTYFNEELSITDMFFKERGFVLDPINSSTSTSDSSFYDYLQSYKKDKELCVIKVNPDNISLSVSCGNTFDESYTEQIPFIKAIKDFKPEYTNLMVRIHEHSGDFFKVGVGGFRGGSSAVIKKEGNNYRVLYISQEDPYCKFIENENIPDKTLKLFKINGCYEGGKLKRF